MERIVLFELVPKLYWPLIFRAKHRVCPRLGETREIDVVSAMHISLDEGVYTSLVRMRCVIVVQMGGRLRANDRFSISSLVAVRIQ
jgi:hypothetical protein